MSSIKSIKEIKQDREKAAGVAEEYNCDVLVIGGGGAGLAAAIEAGGQ